MSSEKTTKLGLHKWVPTDYVKREEFNENFAKIDDHAAEVTSQLEHVDQNKLDKNTSDISIAQINKNKGLIDETYLSPELKAQIAGNTPIHSEPADRGVLHRHLAERVVTPLNTTFARSSKNLFDGYFVRDFSISGNQSDGGTFNNSAGFWAAIVKLEKGETFTISKSESDRFRVATSIGYPVVGQAPNRYLFIFDTGTKYTFTTEGEEDYVIVVVSSSNGLPPLEFQVEKGSVQTDYEEPGKTLIDLPKRAYDTTIIKNIHPTGTIVGLPTSFVVDNEEKTIKTISSGGLIVVGDSSYELKNATFSYADTTVNSVIVTFDITTKDIEFYGQSQMNTLSPTKAILGIIRKEFNKVSLNGVYTFNKPYFLSNIPQVIYKSNEPYLNIFQRNHEYLYGLYDQLMAKYPEYITKTLIATEESGLPIYRYDFKPKVYGEYIHPKVVYSHPHGHEIAAVYGAYTLFKSVCENWMNSEVLNMFRWHVHFVVIPLLNPWGFNNEQRKNFNGVDLNRNMPSGWTFVEDTSSVNYAGANPLSEIATQKLYEIMTTEKNVVMAVDHHNMHWDITDAPMPLWIGSNKQELKKVIFGVTQEMYAHFLKEYNPSITDLDLVVNSSTQSGIANEWTALGKNGFILENLFRIDGNYEHGQQYVAETLASLIKATIQHVVSN